MEGVVLCPVHASKALEKRRLLRNGENDNGSN